MRIPVPDAPTPEQQFALACASADGAMGLGSQEPEVAPGRVEMTARRVPAWKARLVAAVGVAGALAVPYAAVWLTADAGERARVLELRPELVWLPGGTFEMGSSEEPNESPRHSVTVSSFAIGRTEVTVAHYAAVMGERPSDCMFGCADSMPVQNVSWEDAVRYANRLTALENELRPDRLQLTWCYTEGTWEWDRECTGYRLPTEAEWEYAARAGSTTRWSFGDDMKEICMHGNVDTTACNDGYENFAPVASFAANAWGLHDMHGNVWEWVYDWYDAGFYGKGVSVRNVTNPVNLVIGAPAGHVLRSGAVAIRPEDARSASRTWNGPSIRNWNYGLRVVLPTFTERVLLASGSSQGGVEVRRTDLPGDDVLLRREVSGCPENSQGYRICSAVFSAGQYRADFLGPEGGTYHFSISTVYSSTPIVVVHKPTRESLAEGRYRDVIPGLIRNGQKRTASGHSGMPCLQIHVDVDGGAPVLFEGPRETETSPIVKGGVFYFDDLLPGGYQIKFSDVPGYTSPKSTLMQFDGWNNPEFGAVSAPGGSLLLFPKSACDSRLEFSYTPLSGVD